MREFLIFFTLFIAYAVSSDDFAEVLQKESQLYPRQFSMPVGEESVRQVDLNEGVDYEILNRLQRNPALNQYLLYTRRNHNVPQSLAINNIYSVLDSNFDPRKNTAVLIHGWNNVGANSEPIRALSAVLLDKEDVNVIRVDYTHLTSSGYITSTAGAPEVGKHIGKFINWLHETFGLPYEQVHVIGNSLGAHVAGAAGRETDGRVARVTGLDPAGPLWNFNSQRLGRNDGVYVEAIHTDGGYIIEGYGIGTAIADVDFFPNGGKSQPGCLTNNCNHDRAYKLFAATITLDHLEGRRCSNSLQMTLNRCSGDRLKMGNGDMKKTGRSGSYRVKTGRKYPY